MQRVPLIALFALGCSGSHSGGECQPQSTAVPEEGTLRTPLDVSQLGCEPGSLAGFEPEGIYFVDDNSGRPFGRQGPVTFVRSCTEPLQVLVGGVTDTFNYPTVVTNDDYLFWRTRFELDEGLYLTRAYMICGRDGDTFFGTLATCFESESEADCEDTPLTMIRHGRKEGEEEAEGLELISEFRGPDWPENGFTPNVRVQGDMAYVVVANDGLRIIDHLRSDGTTRGGQLCLGGRVQ